MEKKNNLLKSIFFVFFSFCLLATGITTLNNKNTNYSIAENTTSEGIDNGSLPSYFSAVEYLGDDKNSSSLIDANTFMYVKEGSNSTSLKLSLTTNGNLSDPSNDVYNYVYYPDLTDTSIFYFYSISSISLEINGEHKEINMGNYIKSSGLSFPNKPSTQLEQFEMIFNDKGVENNEIKIVDDNGNVIEGVYSLSLTFALYTCTDGKTNTEEEVFEDENITINYSFYVVDKESYFLNNRPNFSYSSFDHEVPLSNLTNRSYAYFLYSNYSSEESANKIPYIEYDYTRYDLKISKEHLNSTYTTNLLFDTDPTATTPIVEQGDSIINLKIDETNKLCKVYFSNVGNYDLTLSAIHVAENGTGEIKKYSLDGINSVMKKIMVYVYGYQTNYTDHDKPADENNIRPVGELKSYDFEKGEFEQSADITSSFLNSNPNYSQAQGNTTFLISNILNYINNEKIDPVTTNQTPIKLSANASLSTSVNSYIYSTTKVSDAYTLYQSKALNNSQDLYRTTFSGSTAGTDGTYIYVIAYTFKNYYLTETTLANTTTFYQVFYFKIVKSLPSIEIKTVDGNINVDSDTYTNKDVNIIDTTKNPYNKDVTIQIYAYDYTNKQYLSKLGGTQGISFDSLKPANSDEDIITLTDSAFYTIRLYYSSEITSLDILSEKSKDGLFREEAFTIDKNPVENIVGRNVSEITNSTNYSIGSVMTSFATNQSIIVSWNEKKSGASTYAYYRYFPIIEAQYYSNQEALLSATLDTLLNSKMDNSWLPVNNLLNMDTSNNIWLPYKENSLNFNNTISTEYVLSDSGLYLFDVYDAAGNHTVEVFMIDNTTPVFAVYDGLTYSLTSSSIYVTTPSTLFWSKNKAIFMANFKTLNYNSSVTSSNVTVDDLKYGGGYYDFYLLHDKTPCVDIYKVIYDKLFVKNYMTMINCPYTPDSNTDGTSDLITGYSGLYITIPINETSYYIDKDHETYTPQTNVYKQEISVDKELTYRVLIRDLSNTKFYTGYESSPNATLHYTNHYSAKQTIIISFDSSEFFIEYTNNSNEKEIFSSNDDSEGSVTTEDGIQRKTKISYLSPTSISKPLTLSFLPTITGEELLIQVDSVTIKYYPYIEQTIVVDGISYHYYQLSEEATEFNVYDFATNGSMTDYKKTEIRLNADNVTTAGKYVITRTYYIEEPYSFNENDYFERTYVLYVDRNEVISNAELVSDKDVNGNVTNSHLESLVGGDVFVAMYDNGLNSSLVVTFPDSENGNSNGSSLYNNGTVRSILSTNMLPVYVYVPQYKYTKYVQKKEVKNKNGETTGYSFYVENNEDMNQHYEGKTIAEYNLFAEIYKDDTKNLIALSSTNSSNPRIDNIAVDTNTGFLKFCYKDGTPLQYLSEPGTYYIKITQGLFGTELGENDYTQLLTFSFTIQDSQPDFTVQSTTGASLNSDIVTTPTADSPSEIYYTNQPEVTLLWNAGSTYMADIEIEKIVFKTSDNVQFSVNDDIFTKEPTLSNNMYIAQLNLKQLNIYKNDQYVDITMQYKNHDDKFYKKVTKRIYVDLSAPNTNIQTLVSNSISNNMIPSLTESALRTYYTANMELSTDLNSICYNISSNTGTFAYYSYMTTQDFLGTLKNSSDANETYIREFSDISGNNTKYTSDSQQETAPADFLISNFTNLNNFTSFEINKYYEIVETDKAGNMTIYTVYITNYSATESDEDSANNLFTYQTYDDDKKDYFTDYYTISDYQLTKTYSNAINNIYAKTGFSLKNINFFGDAWAQIKLTTLNSSGMSTTKYLMLTPWDSDYAYAFVGSNYTKIKISDLLDGTTSSRYKNCFSIYNRENKKTEDFYFNIRNTNLTANLTDDQSKEYIKFSMPVDSSIQSTIYATTYLTSLTIKSYKPNNNNEAELLYQQDNKLGYASLWASNANITATTNGTSGTLIFEINPDLEFVANTRIVYEYEDNYGNKYKEIHIYKETLISKEITSQNDLYSYYDSTNGRLIYITKDGFQYRFNPNKYTATAYDMRNGEITDKCELADYVTTNDNGISTLTVTQNTGEKNYNYDFAIEVRDSADETNLVKTIYFTLYDELPIENNDNENNELGEFKILDANGVNITNDILNNAPDDEVGYFSEIRIIYSNKETFIPIKYSISTDKTNWTEITSGTRLKCETQEIQKYYLKIWYDESYLKNELGTPEYIFGYVLDDQIYEFNLSSLTSTFWIENTLTGSIVNKSNTIYKTTTGTQYSNHYIVNLKYSDKDYVEIKTNKEQLIKKERVETFTDGSVISEHWIISNTLNGNNLVENIPVFNTDIIITYIPPSDNFVDEFYTYNLNGIIDTTENLVNATSKNFVVSENYSSINRIELQWTKYYGIVQNEINIKLVKDGIELNPIIYSRKNGTKEYNYLYLTYSGKYTITLYDNSGNIQKFNKGNVGQRETFSFVFLKDVPFTVTYTNQLTGELETSLPIKQAVYNGSVTINIDKNTRTEFYSLNGYPVISVKKNGAEYTKAFNDDTTYIFNESGYYEIYFTATSNIQDIGILRKEVYQFTILNPNEYRYSYVYNRYSNYYVERVVKDDVDITQDLVKTLDVSTITINKQTYLTELPLSYLDEKTGSGVYVITINSNDKLFNSSSMISSFTFKVIIQVGEAPIKISIAEGESTTSNIKINFNTANIYNEMGECDIKIVKYDNDNSYTYYKLSITENMTGETSTEISTSGTFYIQIISPSGNLLYSYKVIRNEPLNTAAIVAIVISAIVLLAVIIIVIKLRKRIVVK